MKARKVMVMAYVTRCGRRAVGLCAAFLLLHVVPGAVAAQNRITFSTESTLTVDGTSNQSDWSVYADSVSGWVALGMADGSNPIVSGGEVHVLSAAMVSRKSPIMDRLMRRALKTDEFSEIVFELTSAEPESLTGAAPDTFAVLAQGNLTIAGITKQVAVVIGGEPYMGGYRFAGSYPLKMTDYGMVPPTALFGALHTGDAVVVRFDLIVPGN